MSRYFAPHEMACKRLGLPVPPEFVSNMERLFANLDPLRRFLKRPIHIISGYRPPQYNARLKGAAVHSQHLTASAADIVVEGVGPGDVADSIESLILRGRMVEGGLGRYPGWTHVDVRGRRARWRR